MKELGFEKKVGKFSSNGNMIKNTCLLLHVGKCYGTDCMQQQQQQQQHGLG